MRILLKVICVMAICLLLSCGLIYAVEFIKSLDLWVSLGCLAAIIVICFICREINWKKEKSAHSGLVTALLKGDQNDAVERAMKMRKSYQKQILPYIENGIMARFNFPNRRFSAETYSFWLQKLSLINPDSAQTIVDAMRRESVEKLQGMIAANASFEDICQYLKKISNHNHLNVCLDPFDKKGTLKPFYQSLLQTAMPCIAKTIADIEAGQSVRLKLVPYDFTVIDWLRYERTFTVTLKNGYICDQGQDITLTNFVVIKDPDPIQRVCALYRTSGQVVYLYSGIPDQALQIQLLCDMLQRLPEESRIPDPEVHSAIMDKYDKDIKAQKDFAEVARSEEERRNTPDYVADYWIMYNN